MDKLEKYLRSDGQAIASVAAPERFEATIFAAFEQAKKQPDQPTAQDTAKKRGLLWNKKSIIGVIAVAACLIFALISLLPLGGGSGEFNGLVTIEAKAATADGIDRNEGFVLKASEPLDEETLAKNLTVEPYFEYEINKASKTSYEIVPTQALAANTVYVLQFNNEGVKKAANSWAFETTEGFELTNSYPYDGANNVNINSGIELSFSTPCELEAIKKAVTIEPAIKGEWKTEDGRLLTFIPAEEMAHATVYSLTVPADLTAANGSALGLEKIIRFETMSANAEQQSSAVEFFSIERLDNTAFAPDQAPFFTYYNYDGSNDNEFDIDITVYGYANLNDYTEALNDKIGEYDWCIADSETLLDTKDLKQVMQATVEPYTDPQQPWYKTLYLPDSLPCGFYLLDFKSADCQRQVLIQVTELSIFNNYSAEEALLWVHDINNNKPIAGAEIKSVYGKSISAKTDQNGVAQIGYYSDGKQLLQVKNGKQEAAILIRPYYYFNNNSLTAQSTYWLSFNTDRTIYRSGDTVNFFGIVAPRKDGAKPLDKVVISSNLMGESFTVPVTDGWFAGSYTLPTIASGNWCNLIVKTVAGDYLEGYGFDVRNYDKPAYRLAVSARQKYVMLNDLAEFDINTAYFDDTALPKQDLNYYAYNLGSREKKDQLTTDDNGKAHLSLRTVATEYSSKSLTGYASLDVYTTWPELGRVNSYNDVVVFNTDLELNGSVKRTAEGADITFKPYKINLDKITEENPGDYKDDFSGSAQIKLVYYKQWWEKIQEGTTYHPYLKQNVPYYRYEYHKDYEGEKTVTLNQAEQTVSCALAEKNSYIIEASGQDSQGRSFVREYYTTALKKDTLAYEGDYERYYLQDKQESYDFGDQVNLQLTESESIVELPSEATVLYYRSQERLLDYKVEKTTEYSFTFTEDLAPVMTCGAVYYDGQKYHAVSDAYINFNSEQRTLKAKVSAAEGTEFAPGAEVTLNVELSDNEGKPVSGIVNLNLVDEALLAVSDQFIDLPQTVFFGHNRLAYFFKEANMKESANDMMYGGAEGGGEGDGGREDFRDTALFTSVETDGAGHGSTSFTLPDNITSWRVFWQAYRYDKLPDIWVGNGTGNIIATQDFFIDYRLATVLMKGDQPTLGLRAAGDALKPGSTVNYSVTLKGENTDLQYNKTVTGNLSQWVDIPLDKVKENCTLTVSGSVEGNEQQADKLTVKLTAVDSLAGHAVTDTQALSNDYRVPTDNLSQTLLLFSNQTASKGLAGLFDLAVTDTIRLEQRLTAFLSQSLLKEHFGIDYFITDERAVRLALLDYQDQQAGGIRPLPAANADLEVSVLAAMAAPDYFDNKLLTNYFSDYLTAGNDKERALALWGLAALHQPYMKQVDELYNTGNLDGEAQLYLALALYAFGEGAKAEQLAKDLVANYSEDLGGSRRATVSESEEETIKATARLALLASAYNLPEADDLYTYLQNNSGVYDHYLLERYLILQAMLKYGTTEGSFKYSFDGKTTEVDLSKNYYHSLAITAEAADQLKFSRIKGDITVTACYFAAGLPTADSEAAKNLSLSRSYKQNGELTTDFKQGSEITVILDFAVNANAPDGCYNICDYLPAGLDFVRMDNNASSDIVWLCGEVDGRQTFCTYKSNESKHTAPTGKIVYTARVKMPGSFSSEGAYLQNVDNNKVVTVLEDQRVTIK
ncbi:MAG: Ig-like domain-containing protein [Clostridia bacterium]|nr:Ig-like domain-containing protein [Clostridia bacterium]